MQNNYSGLYSLIDAVEVRAGTTLQFGKSSFEVVFVNSPGDLTAITKLIDREKGEYLVGIKRHIPKRHRTMVSLPDEKKVILLHEIVETLEQRLLGELPDYKTDPEACLRAVIKGMQQTHNEACRQELLYSQSRAMERVKDPPF